MLQYFKGIKNRILPSRRTTEFYSKGFEPDVVKNNDVVRLKVFRKRINNFHRNIGFFINPTRFFFEQPPTTDNIQVGLKVFRKRINNYHRSVGFIKNPIYHFVFIPSPPEVNINVGLKVYKRRESNYGYNKGFIRNPIYHFVAEIPPPATPSTNVYGAILTIPTRSFRIQGYRRM